MSWVAALPASKKHLWGGLKIGWESAIGVNFFFYPHGNQYYDELPDYNVQPATDPQTGLDFTMPFAGGVQPLGYAALAQEGIWSRQITNRDQDRIIQKYLEHIARTCAEMGVPADHLFTHGGGQYATFANNNSFAVSINDFVTPGWSFYSMQYPGDLGDLDASLSALGSRSQEWCAPEWYAGGAQSRAAWAAEFEEMFAYRVCRFVSVVNWDGGEADGTCLSFSNGGVDGLRDFLDRQP